MTDDAFQDKVQSEFKQVYQQNHSGSPAWTFFLHADDKTGVNATAKKDTESTALYLQGETPKAKDIVDGPKDGAKTEANAKALEKESSSSSTEKSSESKASSSDDSQTETRMSSSSSSVERSSSSSSSHTETDSEATFSDLTGDE